MPPALAVLLRDQLCRQDPKLLTVVCADLDEDGAIDRAATVFAVDEPISINKVAERLGLSRKVVVELFRRGFKEKVRKWRDTMTAAQKYAQDSVRR
jgi:AraC-like DNA-binding protein